MCSNAQLDQWVDGVNVYQEHPPGLVVIFSSQD